MNDRNRRIADARSSKSAFCHSTRSRPDHSIPDLNRGAAVAIAQSPYQLAARSYLA
jgi:hypothetical protein